MSGDEETGTFMLSEQSLSTAFSAVLAHCHKMNYNQTALTGVGNGLLQKAVHGLHSHASEGVEHCDGYHNTAPETRG